MSRPLNIPSGNSTITPDPGPLPEEERLTGDTWQDYKRAIKVRRGRGAKLTIR